jgi:hypothetical protein
MSRLDEVEKEVEVWKREVSARRPYVDVFADLLFAESTRFLNQHIYTYTRCYKIICTEKK